MKHNKPSKIKRLRNSIQVALKLEKEHDVDKVLRLLADLNIIQTDHKTFIFAMKHIQYWGDKNLYWHLAKTYRYPLTLNALFKSVGICLGLLLIRLYAVDYSVSSGKTNW